MKFYCIADRDTVRGFQLAGIDARVALTAEEALIVFNETTMKPDCGILILTETVAAWIKLQVDAIRLERNHPLIVEISGPEGPLSGHKSLKELVQEAVGVSVG